MFLKRILYYLNPATLFERDEHSGRMRFMNGVNRLGLYVFIASMVVLVVRACNR